MTWDLGEDVVESEEGDQIVEWLRENGATLGNTGDRTLRHSTTGRWTAIDLSIHMGEAFISDHPCSRLLRPRHNLVQPWLG